LKKYFKFIVIALVVVLSSVLLRSLISKNAETHPVAVVEVIKEVALPVLIERYAEAKTQKVSHKLDSLLQRINKRNDFHGSLLVAKNGKILYNNYIGFADFGKKKPLNEASVFQLASVSKQFTAAAIMLLYERNQIQLTDTVNNYFPDFPYENVTIKNLLIILQVCQNIFGLQSINGIKKKHLQIVK